jgi:hypothetical protein
MTLVCCCSLPPIACKHCSEYIKEFGYQEVVTEKK